MLENIHLTRTQKNRYFPFEWVFGSCAYLIHNLHTIQFWACFFLPATLLVDYIRLVKHKRHHKKHKHEWSPIRCYQFVRWRRATKSIRSAPEAFPISGNFFCCFFHAAPMWVNCHSGKLTKVDRNRCELQYSVHVIKFDIETEIFANRFCRIAHDCERERERALSIDLSGMKMGWSERGRWEELPKNEMSKPEQ